MRLEDRALSFFPPPAFIAFPTAGIDISEAGVKCVSLRYHGMSATLASYAELPLPRGSVRAGDIESSDKLIDVLRTLRLRYGVHYANAALSERKAYLYQAIVPFGTPDMRAAIEAELETHVPLPPGEAVFDYEPVKAVEEGLVVSVTAYAHRIVASYEKAFAAAGITLRALEVESHAIARAALPKSMRHGAAIVLDFGKHSTKLAIVEEGVVSFTTTLDVGGDTFTAAIMKLFNLDEPAAEKMKNEKGFLMSDTNADVVEALLSGISVLHEEIAQHVSFWNSASEGIAHEPVSKIVICGGSAKLKGFPEYLEGVLGLPVLFANAWDGVFSLDEYVPPMPFATSLEYATAIGLAKRGAPNTPW